MRENSRMQAQLSNESPSEGFKRPNGLAQSKMEKPRPHKFVRMLKLRIASNDSSLILLKSLKTLKFSMASPFGKSKRKSNDLIADARQLKSCKILSPSFADVYDIQWIHTRAVLHDFKV